MYNARLYNARRLLRLSCQHDVMFILCCPCRANLTRSECLVNWSEFCRDPWGSSDKVHDKNCLARSKSYMYFHMMDQHHCMVTDTGDWAVDFIGRVEKANDDWSEVGDDD